MIPINFVLYHSIDESVFSEADMSVSTQYMFVSSANADRDGEDNSSISFEIPEDSLRANTGEFLRLSLVQHSMINTIRNVPDGSTITINTQVFNLPEGTYRICDYVDAFNALVPTLQATHKQIENRILFANTSNEPATIEFSEELTYLFGVVFGSTLVVPANSTILSPRVVLPQRHNELVVAIGGVIPGPPQNIANLGVNGMVYSDIIGIIPLRAAPNTLNVFDNDNSSFEVHLYDTDVQTLGLRILDIDRKPLRGLPTWSAVIRVDVVRRISEDPVSQRLDRILDYLQLHTLMVAADKAEGGNMPMLPESGVVAVPEVYFGNRQ